MAKYRFEATIAWGLGDAVYKQRHIPIDFFSPNYTWAATPSARSDYCTNTGQLRNLETVIMGNKAFTLVVLPPVALMFSRGSWQMRGLIVSAYEGERHVSSIASRRPKQSRSIPERGRHVMSFEAESADPYVPKE